MNLLAEYLRICGNVLAERESSKITCVASESPTLSKIGPPQKSFFQNKGGHDLQGGGAVRL